MDQNYLPYIKRLKNQVFPVAYERICTDFSGEEFTAENVQLSFDNVKMFVNELRFLKRMQLQHPLTRVITQQKIDRHQQLLSLRGRVTYFLKSPVAAERNAAIALEIWLLNYHESFKSPTISEQTGLVNNMDTEIKHSTVLMESIAALNLNGTLDSIHELTAEMNINHKKRSDDRKAALRKATLLREAAFKKLTTFWKSIEVAIELGTADVAVYTEYLNQINWTMIEYKAMALNSKTRSVNAALKAEEEKENALPEDGEQSNSTQSAGMQNRSAFSFVPTNETEEHDDLASQEAAMQSKTIEGGAVSTIPVNGDQEHDTAEKPEKPIAKQDASTNGSDRES